MEDTKTYHFIADMHCKSCEAKLHQALKDLAYIQNYIIDFEDKTLTVHGNILDLNQFENMIFQKTHVFIEQLPE